MKHTIVVRYAEIGLKGKNRPYFEKLLVKNIKRALKIKSEQITLQWGQIVVRAQNEWDKNKHELRKVFGIAWFARAAECKPTIQDMEYCALLLTKTHIDEKTTFAVRATRSEKDLPFTSKDVENHLGTAICKQTKSRVNLSNPELTVHVSIQADLAFVFINKIRGAGGLPVGSSGSVLSLLSGGFDSIAASYQLAKRGARVDFLHFHIFPSTERVSETKMPSLWKNLSQYTLSNKVFLASYTPFQMQVLEQNKRDERYELVVFRRLMVRVAEKIAEQGNYKALVLGDSLGQVASQTMENIVAVDDAVSLPIFRPLIGTDKIEVIDLVKKIGMEQDAIAHYKDCCSIVSTHPATRANLEKVTGIEKSIKIEKIVDEMVEQIEIVTL